MSDRALVQRAIDGDSEAYATLARASARRLYLVAHRILRDADAADDAVQQTLVTIWKELPRLRDAGSFEGWSYRIVTRAAIAEAKRRVKRHSIVEIGTDERSSPDSTASVELRDELERAFCRLTPEARAVVVLRYYADLTHKDIAYALGIAPGTVASRLHRALGQLRSTLSIGGEAAAAASTVEDESLLLGESTR